MASLGKLQLSGIDVPTYAEQHAKLLTDGGKKRRGGGGGGGGGGGVRAMQPGTAALLRGFYRPYNEKLAALLGDERFKWDAGSSGANRSVSASIVGEDADPRRVGMRIGVEEDPFTP